MQLLRMCIGLLFTITILSGTCSSTNAASNIAVADFRINSPNSRLSYLAEGLASSLAVKLANIEGIIVVERSRINEAFTELRLGMAGMLDASSATQLGRQVGAQLVVLGELVDYNGLLQLSVRVVDVATGSLRSGFSDECASERDLPRAIERLAGRIAGVITGNTTSTTKNVVVETLNLQAASDVSAAIAMYKEPVRHYALGIDLSTVNLFYKDGLLGYPHSSMALNPHLGVSYRRYFGQPNGQLVEKIFSSTQLENLTLSMGAVRNDVKEKLGNKLFLYAGAHTEWVIVPWFLDAGVTYDLTNADGLGFNLNASLLLNVRKGGISSLLGVQYTF